MTNRLTIAAIGGLALAACALQPAPPQYGSETTGKCDSTNIQQFVGKLRSDALEQEMLRISGASRVRWAPYGSAVTMEYSDSRLTVFLDAGNRVERISCS